ncbi:hypothetical protein Q3C01_04485 [Bradyrhizobium sp. UFLA05-109]
MKLFARQKPSDVWDEPIQWPIGDIAAADRIRNICQSASASAELIGGPADHGGKSLEKQRKCESERYERAARVAMEIAMKISDDLMRDDAVRHIIDLCMKAGDIKTAHILYRAIHANWIREAAQKDYPALGQ